MHFFIGNFPGNAAFANMHSPADELDDLHAKYDGVVTPSSKVGANNLMKQPVLVPARNE